jgi:hypothetical protein
MTNEQINVAIAEACGWKAVWVRGDSGFYKGFDNGAELRPDLPDYCNDLNAMHEAEWSLTDDQLWRMARNIERNDEQWYFRATARQRAEAFLRTLGKWEEKE